MEELVSAPPVEDPRVRSAPIRRENVTIHPLTRRPGGMQAYKLVVDPVRVIPESRVHEGYEWLYVLNGRLRLVLGEHDIVMKPSEAAEFYTQVPHWFGAIDDRPVEILSLFGPKGQRIHIRTTPARDPKLVGVYQPTGYGRVGASAQWAAEPTRPIRNRS